MSEPSRELTFRLDAAQREVEALRAELAARTTADLEAKLADLEAENLRLRAKVNTLVTLITEPPPV